ncbi:MAG: alanine racemase [Proteobacteria bacterium]|nr:alanine racemase [Pseudomonadota bacterium]
MSRPARASFDLAALRANYAHAKARHGGRAAATLKANAYGHGAVQCARALAGVADAFAVAFVQEALELREAGIEEPILVLEGAFGMGDVELARQHGLWLVVHQEEQLAMLESLRSGPPLQAWLKIDTGMHRAGVAPGQAQALWQRLKACEQVAGITLMTHLASADEPDNPATDRQLAVFEAATQGLPGPRSVANSAGVLCWKGAHRDWARPGIMLYGADPRGTASDVLRPVMQLTSEVFSERWIATGEPLGYGGSFVAERPTRVGLVAMGYADGYPRRAHTGTPVGVDGRLTRIIGRVAMDMLTVDLTDLPESGPGSSVELWGRQVSVNDVAAAAGTIAYELLCNVKRVGRVYL